MKKDGQFKYYRVVPAFIIILLIFLFIVISVIVSHHQEMMKDIERAAQRELNLVGSFARDALLRQDYASIEYFLDRWAEEHKEIIALKATAPNEFTLFDFQRPSTPTFSFHLKEQVSYKGKALLSLEVIRDMSPAQRSMLTLRFRLILGSIFITALLGLVLWSTMRKFALAPLEKEIALKEQAEKKFRMLLESAPDSIIYTNARGKILMVNGQTERLFGYPRGELEGKGVEILMPERFRSSHRQFRKKFITTPNIRSMGRNLELFGYTKNGREFPADISLSPVEMDDGLFILSSVRDISERKIAEGKITRNYYFQSTISEILRISLEPLSLEEQLYRILQSILAIPDLSGQSMGSIYLVNEGAESMTLAAQIGFSARAASGQAVLSISKGTCSSALIEQKIQFVACPAIPDNRNGGCAYESPHSHYCVPIISGDRNLGAINLVTEQHHRKSEDEEDLLTSIANTIAGIIEHNRSNREKQKLQNELAHAEKLSALGRLTANVAHEIRNPLALIGGFARKLYKNTAEGSKDKEYWDIVISEVNRLEKILKNVLTYSREASLNREVHSMKEIIDSVLRTYQNVCVKKAVHIQKNIGRLESISVDKDQVWIVLNNLFSNALDSMPEGGTLRVSTEESSVSGEHYLVVTVSDTGKGIPEEQIKAIFEPFYSTKVLGRGTGLGLSISKKIIEDHGGLITAESALEEGTTFRLYFPLAQ